MKFVNNLKKEEGYLLLESIVTLTIITTILIVIYPLMIEWLVLEKSRAIEVELARAVYQESFEWPDNKITNLNKFNWSIDKNRLSANDNNQQIEVVIYEVYFEK